MVCFTVVQCKIPFSRSALGAVIVLLKKAGKKKGNRLKGYVVTIC